MATTDDGVAEVRESFAVGDAAAVLEPEAPVEEGTCAELVHHAVGDAPGIYNPTINSHEQRVELEYDPRIVSDQEAEQVAQRVAHDLSPRLTTCTLHLHGRACEACAVSLERNMRQLPGVQRASASIIGGTLAVTYDQRTLTPEVILDRARRWDEKIAGEEAEKAAERVATEAAPPEQEHFRIARWLGRRLELVLMLVTFATMWLGYATYGNPDVPRFYGYFFYGIAYCAGGYYGLLSGIQSLRHLTIDVDLLMILAALGAAKVGHPFEGAMLLFLFALSNVLQDYALDRTRNAIKSLMKLRPTEALCRRDGRTRLLPIEQVVVGDHLLVRPGERVPLDGTIIEGASTLDESTITGESMPVAKQLGDTVLAGTINQSGGLEIEVTKLAKDSTIARLIKLVEEAQSEKAPTQRFLDKFEQYYALGVIGFTILMILVPPLVSSLTFNEAFYRAMTLMVVASPCALVISTPATILSAIANGARRGVLFKGGAHLEQAAKIKVVAFDKTGTLTEGKPRVTDVTVVSLPMPALANWQGHENDVLSLAAAVEAKSEHPLAQAIVQTARHRGVPIPQATSFQATTGKGVRANVGGIEISVGSPRHFKRDNCVGLDDAMKLVGQLQDEGKTSVLVAWLEQEQGEAQPKAHILGVIAIADTLRPDAPAVVRELKTLGVQRVVMLTGDNKRVAKAIAKQAGVDAYFADLLPQDKVRLIKRLGAKGAVAMVGDGVNDAPALATADLGIAMGAAGTDVALETADVVLMGDDLRHIPYAMALSRQSRRVIVQNISFACGVIVLLLCAALGLQLALPYGVVGHEGSTVLVCLNGLRLLVYSRA